jgi:hypothetical protein
MPVISSAYFPWKYLKIGSISASRSETGAILAAKPLR